MISPLSTEFKIACEIYRYNQKNEPVWYKKLCDRFNDLAPILKISIDSKRVGECIDTLFDWGIIGADYGSTDMGHAGRRLFITKEAAPIIRELYKKYWVV